MNLKYIILFLILFLICVGIYYFKLIKENMETNIDLKNLDAILDNSEIPLHIYQTWHSNTLPQYMQECVNKLKKDNPEFSYHFYNDFDCREYIKDNFNKLDCHFLIGHIGCCFDLHNRCLDSPNTSENLYFHFINSFS